MRRRGAEDRHVGRRHGLGQPGEVDHGRSSGSEAVGVTPGPVAHGHRGAEPARGPDHLVGDMPGADHQKPLAGQGAAVASRGQPHGRGRYRAAGTAERGMPVHPAGGVDRGGHQPVQLQAAQPGGPAGLSGGPDLPHDVGLAEHEGLEPGGDPQQVVRGPLADQHGGGVPDGPAGKSPVAGERLQKRLGVERVGARRVDLGALAGREQGELGEPGAAPEVHQDLRHVRAGNREPLEQRHRHPAARHRDTDQAGHREPSSSIRASTVSTVVRCAPNGAASR